MSSLLLEQLDNAGLLQGRRPNTDLLARIPVEELIDVAVESVSLTSADRLNRQDRPAFSSIATLSFAGAPWPCEEIRCRLKHARNLAQFAALYSDRVFIQNLLTSHATDHRIPEEEKLRRIFFGDLAVIGFLRPLIEEGIIVPVTPSGDYCSTCFVSLSANKSFRDRLDAVSQWFERLFLQEAEVHLCEDNYGFSIEIRGPQYIIEHGAQVILPRSELVPELKKLIRLHSLERKLKTSGKIRLTKKHLRSGFEVQKALSRRLLLDIGFEIATAQCFGGSIVTDRRLNVDALNKVVNDDDLVSRNLIAQEHLAALVPFIEAATPEELLKLRVGERESFVLFRAALSSAIEEYRKAGRDFTVDTARQLYGDVIEPSLARLDIKVNAAKRKILKNGITKATSTVGAIVFGVWSGLLSEDLLEVAKRLGLAKIVGDLMGSASGTGKRFIHKDFREEPFYFLWRVREQSAKR